MAKTRTQARCGQCGHTESKWLGQCPACEAWGSMADEAAPRPTPGSLRAMGNGRAEPVRPARPIREVPLHADPRMPTGLAELDRVLGGGFVPGSVTLFGGAPGAGKSTLLLQAADALARSGKRVLYISAEESVGQVRLRAERLGTLSDRLLLSSETDLDVVAGLVEAHGPDLLLVDSIQTVRDPDTPGAAGGISQVRECAAALVRSAKQRGMACVLVGHVTKDGHLAGPRVLEHLVDTVCDVEGDRHHALRLLRATKNRFGPVGEVGCFEMTGQGMTGIADAGRLFLGELAEGSPGVAVTLALEGRRPLACEVQALTVPTKQVNPRRVASGLDAARLSLLLAVLERRAEVCLREHDVYASSVGGVRLSEPAVDLALCLAIASAAGNRAVAHGVVALGEVGLAGELRLVAQIERRLAEAARLGFSRALLPAAYDGDTSGLRLHRAAGLAEALAVGLG
ncbi:MAG TPA: DNA repair protein RadA [Egibacteraceae bacterium]|nr:DNA repair protein RadA [Egibacteraceae bacterium]